MTKDDQSQITSTRLEEVNRRQSSGTRNLARQLFNSIPAASRMHDESIGLAEKRRIQVQLIDSALEVVGQSEAELRNAEESRQKPKQPKDTKDRSQ